MAVMLAENKNYPQTDAPNLTLGERDAHAAIRDVISRAGEIILGKDAQIRMAIACILARGHLLIEDVPGVGKTTLSHVRPIFSQVILADEINRASPKAQSALLEAMEEHQVTADGKTMSLPEPFFVIATQNPSHQIGTFPLPESQLDRFLMRISLGYPDQSAERALLKGEDRREMVARVKPAMSVAQLVALQKEVTEIHVSDALVDYVQALVTHTRDSSHFEMGLSPRAGLALLRAAQAWAMLSGRKLVLPEDVQTVAPAVVGHRLRAISNKGSTSKSIDPAQDLIQSVPIP